jgi:hypothetical protein
MPLGILFWVLYLVSIVLGVWGSYAPNTQWYKGVSGYFVLWVLVGILGWSVFGPAVK